MYSLEGGDEYGLEVGIFKIGGGSGIVLSRGIFCGFERGFLVFCLVEGGRGYF